MRKAVLLTCLTLCHARASLLEASAAPEATCTKGNEVAQVPALGALTVTCPGSYTLNPEDPTEVFDTVDCNRKDVKLESLVPGATLKKATPVAQKSSTPGAAPNQSDKYTFTVVQMPPAAVSVFYLCEKAANTESGDNEASGGPLESQEQSKNKQVQSTEDAAAGKDRCTIEIRIAAANPLGPNTCAVEGGKINLDLRAVNETARFSCTPGTELIPQSATRAYDSTCSKETDLPHGLARREENSEYCLDLKKLPKRAHQLCYLCKTANKNSLQSKGCAVHVRTAAGASRGDARGTTALRLALLAVICLYMN